MADVFAVTSGKGGVGKTTTAINLAVALEEAGHSTVVLDADLGMANVGEFLGIDPSATLHDVLSGTASVEEALVKLDSGLSVLPGDPDLESFAAAGPDGLRAVVDSLAEHHQYVIVDTGGGLSYEGIYPIELVDEVILVTSPLPAAVSDTKKSKQLSDQLGVPVRGVVVTHAVDETDSESIADELDVELLCSVPADPNVTESAIQRQSVFEYAPDGPSTAAYRRLASAIAVKEDVETAEAGGDSEDESEDTEVEAETESDSKAKVKIEPDTEEPTDEEPGFVSKSESPDADKEVGPYEDEGVDSNWDEGVDSNWDEGVDSSGDEGMDAIDDEGAEAVGDEEGEGIGEDADSPADDEAEEIGEEESEEVVEEEPVDDVEAKAEEVDESETETKDADGSEKKSGFFSRLLPFR